MIFKQKGLAIYQSPIFSEASDVPVANINMREDSFLDPLQKNSLDASTTGFLHLSA